ncbi:hypothetical protein NDU88_004947 [Pleurodeles waltl]|uniref:Uncharacterized protein n=1 Tax=Pleurodeles waltl TaxID=8319 RepID=A0AAV7RKX9_PLEWA|nr:hypothetical protein NDU88_004947 [Pleurodeles waltl]
MALVSDHYPILGRSETYRRGTMMKGTPLVFPGGITDSILIEDADNFRGRDLIGQTSPEEEGEGASTQRERDTIIGN